MIDCSQDFGPFDGKIWLNSASEGALPRVSVQALQNAITWKIQPHLLTHQLFAEVPQNLKQAFGQLLNVPANDIILGNSATYGIHLLAQGIRFDVGDEVLVMQNDFPTDILPWLTLEEHGVVVRQIPTRNPIIKCEEVLAALTPKTRVVCLPHVHTFSGYILDIQSIGKICRQRNILFVLNVSQSLGYMPLNLSTLPVDAIVSAGFKWLCGPYGTGVCWIRPEWRDQLKCTQAFWVNVLTPDDLATTGDVHFQSSTRSKFFDVFGTANFFNFVPLTRSIQYFLNIGIENVGVIIDQRVEQLIAGLQEQSYKFISRVEKGQRSALIVFSHRDATKNDIIFRKLMNCGIYVARWKGNLRISPHIFNTQGDIATTVRVLTEIAKVV